MIVENAKIADIALLTELRLAYLKEDYGKLSEDDKENIRRDLPSYFEKNLNPQKMDTSYINLLVLKTKCRSIIL